MKKLSPVLDRLKEVTLLIDNLKHVKSHLKVVNQTLSEHYQVLSNLSDLVKQGEKGIDQLENRTLTSMFRNILGDKEKQLDIKRQEYLEASLKYNESRNATELLEYEKDILEKKLLELPALNKELNKLKRDREKEIMRLGSSTLKNQMNGVIKSLENNILHRNEYSQALDAAKKSLSELNYILHHLKKAQDWGQWDMMQNRGSSGKYAKYQAIDRAKSHVPTAQHRINIFRQEIMDVGISGDQMTINLDQLKSFSNVFFDNIISDWLVQQKIVNSLKSVHVIRNSIQDIKGYLTKKYNELQLEYDSLIIHKDELLYAE